MASELNGLDESVSRIWADDVLPALCEYIRIPNVSPAYAPDWAEAGHMGAAARLLTDWCMSRPVHGAQVELIQLPGLTPVLLVEIPARGLPADDSGCVLLYGHMDKQPEMNGWREGLSPWEPVIEDERLYGRGGADDGYSTFAAMTAVEALEKSGGHHARCVVLIEASEESGSSDLPTYIDHLAHRIGVPTLVVALDSGCANYDRLWLTTSLRGLAQVILRVSLLDVGIHSGASGAVASSFRVLRRLLDRIEDPDTGTMLLSELSAEIPAVRADQIGALCADLGPEAARFPLVNGARAVSDDPVALITAQTWWSALSITGLDGAPAVSAAGNVLRSSTTAKLSVRLPPTVSSEPAAAAIKRTLESNPPYGARVEAEVDSAEDGWDAPAEPAWLKEVLDEASVASFGLPSGRQGTGGSIPFVGSLAQRFPGAAFVVTGVLGPGSNAHGPNEFLHLPTARRVTACVARVLAAHARQI